MKIYSVCKGSPINDVTVTGVLRIRVYTVFLKQNITNSITRGRWSKRSDFSLKPFMDEA